MAPSAVPPAAGSRRIVEKRVGSAIRAVREVPAPRSTSYGLQRLLLHLADGRTLDVLVKSFDVSPHLPAAALRRGARERFVYETVLPGRDLGTAELYGVVWDDRGGDHRLMLEFVEGQNLRHRLEDRIAAAGWLGRLHGSVAGHEAEFAEPGLLLTYDGHYFRDTAERAVRAVGARFDALRDRLAAAVAGYEDVVESICAPRPALVHGSYRSSNVLIDTGSTPSRVCPLDWELAAIGPPLHDLAFIAGRYDRPAIERLYAAYAEEAAASGRALPATDEALDAIARLRLHKVLRSLARSAEWAYPPDTVSTLVTSAETIRRALG